MDMMLRVKEGECGMGWKSTVQITKEEALIKIMIALSNPELDNEVLADVVEMLVGDAEGANYRIVG